MMKAWKYCIRINIKIRDSGSCGNYMIQQKISQLILQDLKKVIPGGHREVYFINLHKIFAGKCIFIFFSSPELYYCRLKESWEGRWSIKKESRWLKRKSTKLEYRIKFIKFPSQNSSYYGEDDATTWDDSRRDNVIFIRINSEDYRVVAVTNINDKEKNRIAAKQIKWIEENIYPSNYYLRLREFIFRETNLEIIKIDT